MSYILYCFNFVQVFFVLLKQHGHGGYFQFLEILIVVENLKFLKSNFDTFISKWFFKITYKIIMFLLLEKNLVTAINYFDIKSVIDQRAGGISGLNQILTLC